MIDLKKILDDNYFSDIKEIKKDEDFFNFGNAYSIWRYGNLNLRFVKDRGQLFLDVGSKYDEIYYTFDVLSVFMGWKTIEQLKSTNIYLDLVLQIKLIKKDNLTLQNFFSKENYKTTKLNLQKIENDVMRARFN